MPGRILISHEEVIALIGSIYKAPGDAERWPALLSQLASACKATFGTLDYYDATHKAANITVSLNIDPDFSQEYESYFVEKNAWISHQSKRVPLGMPMIGQMVVPDEDLLRSEFYQDFLRRRDIFHVMGGSVSERNPTTALLSLFRGRNAEPFVEPDLDLFKLLLPHLKQALKLHHHLTAIHASQRTLAEALDRMPIGTIVVDASCQVIGMNKVAREIVAARDGLVIDASGLRAMAMDETVHLRSLVACAAATSRGAAAHPGGVLRVSRPSLCASLAIRVTPTARLECLGAEDRATAIVFVSDPDSIPRVSHLSSLYGLTHAESRLATFLVQGTTLEEAAEELQISQNTARTHLKKIFLKTDVRRQSELVRLFLTGVTALKEA